MDTKTKTRGFHIFDIPSSIEAPCPVASANIRKTLQKNEEVLVTYVGSFAGYQGMDILFAAIPKVVRECPEARFLIIGGDEAEIQHYSEFFQNEGVKDNVTFLGKVAPDILPNYLAASDILLSPRVSGVNTPLKLLDYLKVSRAIVATDVTANRLLLDESTAVMVAPTPDGLSAGIVCLVQDKALREQLGKAGGALCRDRYNFEEYTRRLARCYDYVLGNKETGSPCG